MNHNPGNQVINSCIICTFQKYRHRVWSAKIYRLIQTGKTKNGTSDNSKKSSSNQLQLSKDMIFEYILLFLSKKLPSESRRCRYHFISVVWHSTTSRCWKRLFISAISI